MPEPKIAPLTLLSAGGTAVKNEPWTRLQLSDLPRFDDAQALRAQWSRLHAGQGAFPAPSSGELLEGWRLYHSGDFERAASIGLQSGDSEGLVLANRATAVYANYVEPREATRLALFRHVAERAAAQAEQEPGNCQAHYWHAYALGRYSQGVSVARALAQGFGGKVKGALEHIIEQQPNHADAHLALGAFHAEVIDKVGTLVARMTYGARPEAAIECFERGLELNPDSPSGLMEYAHGLQMLHGESRHAEATRLFERAAAHVPADARERLDVELARAALAD